MNTNPAARCTAASALQHPWLGKYRVSQEELTKIANSSPVVVKVMMGSEEIVKEFAKKKSMLMIYAKLILKKNPKTDSKK
jgi:hypothetical protein